MAKCPSCGYCPHCGHKPAPVYPWPYNPWPYQPNTWPYTMPVWNQSGTAVTAGKLNTTIHT